MTILNLDALPTAPEQRWRWVRPMVPKRLQPYLRGVRKQLQWSRWRRLDQPFRAVYPYTQVNLTRQRNLQRLCEEIEREQIPGDVVECGVLDGGTAALMASQTARSRRAVHLFDAWEGLPPTTSEDGANATVWTGEVVGSPRRVIAAMKRLRVDQSRVVFHRGWFHETFPTANIEKIALLHVDADFYEPTKLIFARWYPQVAPGGYIQIDDYDSFAGCRKAVDEFLAAHPEVKLETWGQWAKARACFIQKPGATTGSDNQQRLG